MRLKKVKPKKILKWAETGQFGQFFGQFDRFVAKQNPTKLAWVKFPTKNRPNWPVSGQFLILFWLHIFFFMASRGLESLDLIEPVEDTYIELLAAMQVKKDKENNLWNFLTSSRCREPDLFSILIPEIVSTLVEAASPRTR